MSEDYDTTEKVEQTETGFRLEVKSTRGTGTRDSDTVKAELRTEHFPTVSEREKLTDAVTSRMAALRSHQPGESDG